VCVCVCVCVYVCVCVCACVYVCVCACTHTHRQYKAKLGCWMRVPVTFWIWRASKSFSANCRSVTRVTWLINTCDMTHQYVTYDSIIYDITCSWILRVSKSFSSTCVVGNTCYMTHSYVTYDSFIHDMTHSYVTCLAILAMGHDSFICDM